MTTTHFSLFRPMEVSLGDTNGNGSVASNDVSVTQSKVGQTVTASTFREDVRAGFSVSVAELLTLAP